MKMKKIKIRNIYLLIIDIIIINLSYIIGLLLRFDGVIPKMYLSTYKSYAVVVTVIQIAIFALFGLYKTMWRYASISEFINVLIATIVSNVACAVLLIWSNSGLPRSIYAIALIVNAGLVGGVRFISRASKNIKLTDKKCNNYKKTMIIGAGEAGVLVVKELAKHAEIASVPVAFIDDDEGKIGKNIIGIPVVGSRKDIPEAVETLEIDEIIVAMPSISTENQQEILNICNKTSAKVKMIPGYYEFIDDKVDLKQIRDVQIEDLLGRDEVHLDQKVLKTFLKDKVILVTGAGGSIGSELCRQIIKYNPKLLVMLDIYENTIYDIQNEILRNDPNAKIEVIIDTIRDKERMDILFNKYRPNIVFHAAAHKHVPLMEDSPVSAVKNNVFGTLNLVRCADKYGVEKLVNISTDKAVNPTSVMGCTKRVCEIIIQTMNQKSKTDFVAVRFGNVLGSNGSVIPLFKKQISEGGPVTVTHPDIIRYFMTIPEACQLVMQAGAIAEGGEIFILDMGEPVKILDLAEKLIKLSGYTPYEDIEIKFTGLRPGEKLYEELLLDKENATETQYNKIFIEKPIKHDTEKFMENLDNLEKATHQNEKTVVVEALKEIVPNFTPDKD